LLPHAQVGRANSDESAVLFYHALCNFIQTTAGNAAQNFNADSPNALWLANRAVESDHFSIPWPRTEARRAKGIAMPSAVIKRSIVLAGHKTSVCLEDSFWTGLKEIAKDSHSTLSNLVNKVDTERDNTNLSSALRVFVFQHFRGGKPNGHGQPDARHAAGSARWGMGDGL